MHQAFIVGPMLASGLALFGSAARIQADRSAWINVQREEPASVQMSVSSLKDEPLVIRPAPAPEPTTVQLPPIEVIGHIRRAAPKVEAPPVVGEVVAEPCSSWQDIGPAHVVDGNALGSPRRVRELCNRLVPPSEETFETSPSLPPTP
jgi:hypothetical protein